MEESDPNAPASHAGQYRNKKSNNNVVVDSNLVNDKINAN